MSGRRRRSNLNRDSAVDFDFDHREERTRFHNNEGNELRTKFNFADIESIIRKFSGSETMNVKRWLEEFDRYANVFQWNELQKFVFCKRSLCGAAKLYIDCEIKPTNYHELKSALFSEFCKKVSSVDIHSKLRGRKKRNDESFREYLYCMIDIASQIELDESSIIEYVIDGIRDTVQNKALLYGTNTIAEFKGRLHTYEKFKSDMTSKYGFTKENDGKTPPTRKNNDDKLIRHCFNCGSKQHSSHNCPDKNRGPKCFKCNQFGHKRSECSQKAVPTTNYSAKSTNFVVKNEMYKPVKINGMTLEGLIDTGSDICLVRENLITVINPEFIYRKNALAVQGVGAKITTKGSFATNVEIDDQLFRQIEIHIVANESIGPDLIVGMNLLRKAKVVIEGNDVKIMKISKDISVGRHREESSCFLAEITIDNNESNYLPDLAHVKSSNMAGKIRNLVANYTPSLPKTSPIQMKIIPLDDKPVFCPPRRFPPREQEIINQQIHDWLQNGIIVESYSDYASPVVLTKKKDGSARLCVDFRQVNKKIHKDHYPLPVIEDQINRLQGASLFTTLDLENGFFHVPIEPQSQKYTAFVTQHGQFEFRRVPFGLCNSPSVFQRFINLVFKNLINEGKVILYIDDIIIPSSSEEEGVRRLEEVLRVAAENGLCIKWKKCQFLKSEVEYLGHVVKKGSISPSPAKIKAVLNFPLPKTSKQLESFLGLTGYFRKFIPGYSIIARPLSDLLKAGNKFVIGPEQLAAVDHLKQILTSEPILKIFKYGAYTELHCDASKYGYGAILLQRCDEDEKLYPVYYASWKTSDTEQRYTSYELEVLAIVQAVKKFRIYLIGTKFKIITDCKAFTCTLANKDLVTRIARWALLLEEFEYEVEHRQGTRMRHVDALSRNAAVFCVQAGQNLLNQLREAQGRDGKIKAIVELLNHGPYKDFVVHHGLLCKEIDGKLLYVVPDNMKTSLIRSIHQEGHFHHQKMKEKIEREFYMEDLKRRIENCISNCVECILSERKSGKPEGLLNVIPKGEVPLDTFHIDHLGPLTATKKGYRYILAVIDGFTKFCWLFPTKTMNAEEVIQKLELVADTFGYPARIIADRGGAFTANSFRSYCTSHNVKLYFITAGVPRGNGQVERLHSTVIAALTKLSLEDPEKWYLHVTPLQKILNDTFHRAIQTTPFQLMIGMRMKNRRNQEILTIVEQELARSFEEDRDELREKARQSIQRIQEENRRQYNRKRKKAQQYNIDDVVAIERSQFGVGLKIKPKFLGPYKIIANKGFDRYMVEKVGIHEGPNNTTVSADKLKKWVAGEEMEMEPDEEK